MTAMIALKGRTGKQAAAAAAQAAALRRRLAERMDVELKRRAAHVGAFHGEQRGSVRSPAWRVGSAAFAPDHLTSCRVVDQSYSGLRLELDEADRCPDEFALTIPTLRFIGIVKTAWRSDDQVGVSVVRWSDAAAG